MRIITFVTVILIGWMLCLTSCSPTLNPRKIKSEFKHSLIVNNHFTGFALYDLDKQQMVYKLNDDKYYNPASNTKLFTFYTALRTLGDSIPALKYVSRGDSLIFWGTGDPSFLHTQLKATRAFNLLKQSYNQLYFSSGSYQNYFFGPGWPWSDYNDYYQAEINELPIADNVAQLSAGPGGSLKIIPARFTAYLKQDSAYHSRAFGVQRNVGDNTFIYPAMPVPANFKQQIPWKTSTALTLLLLQDTLKKPVGEVHLPLPTDAKTIYAANADTVYKLMLQTSDNFIAEQLLLVCSSVKFGVLNKDSIINYATKNYLADLPDAPRWADGSGLSRYNLFTPRSIVMLLSKIRAQVKNDDLLHSLLPAGGISGTLRSTYKTDNGKAFIWAKTGSIANNHNQSGYITTRKGRHLAFSFMNNNFTCPTGEIRGEMVRVMTFIHENY